VTEPRIKTGEEIVEEFFEGVKENEDYDKGTREALYRLFQANIFTRTKVTRALATERQKAIKEIKDGNKAEKDKG
jgi:hypothetical protein